MARKVISLLCSAAMFDPVGMSVAQDLLSCTPVERTLTLPFVILVPWCGKAPAKSLATWTHTANAKAGSSLLAFLALLENRVEGTESTSVCACLCKVWDSTSGVSHCKSLH